ncbi:MAG: FAD-dependent oxidoreductase [Beijerinckiaceae bacterium]
MTFDNSSSAYRSWGGLEAGVTAVLHPRDPATLRLPNSAWLAYGNGRSYGDSCFPESGILIDMRGMKRIMAFNPETGLIRSEAGLTLGDLITNVSKAGWFPAVVPGTRHVTLGGALANDIHGKNHHRAGSFGDHVTAFELLRSDGSRTICTPDQNAGLFRATIGGMGLTGLISWIEMQLMRVSSPDLSQDILPLENLDDFFRLAPASDASHAYSVAWIDSLATGDKLGRGVLLRANHASSGALAKGRGKPLFSVPFTPPFSLINALTLRAFNAAYRQRSLMQQGSRHVNHDSFFFPLDAVGHWNRLYGPAGLRQHQSVLPMAGAKAAVTALIKATQKARHGSFLTVLKLFADRPAAGMMSFPKAGATLTLDFPYHGQKTDRLLDQLDAITIAAQGRVNPYKDAHMSAATFAASYPEADSFQPFIDPLARSRFAVRVGLIKASPDTIR